MRREKHLLLSAFIITSCCIISSCSDDEGNHQNGNKNITKETQYANIFARDILDYYYYWNEEISEDLNLLDPYTNDDPIKTVDEIKYHEGDKYIDRWTMLTDNMDEFTSSVEGTSKTYGYMPIVYRLSENSNDLVAAIAYVSQDSPAEKAELKRGDIIYKINGKSLNTDNYLDLFYSDNISLSLAKLDGNEIIPTEKEISIKSQTMYENPIIADTVFNVNGKKVGYLAYNSFDLESISQLVDISKYFKSQGVSELILDLRYNGGGFVITENVMASMYAPKSAVDNKEVFEKEDYNKNITAEYQKEGISTITHFTTEYNYPDNGVNISTKDANIGLTKIYGIITQNTASASEALLGGLMPYMDVEIIGTKSHGKYCTGWMIAAKDAYKKVPSEIKNWGIYVMASLYKNSKDETPCMPDGIIPDIEVTDEPMETYPIGDKNEAMLKVALARAAGIHDPNTKSRVLKKNFNIFATPRKANYGKRILTSSFSFRNSSPFLLRKEF